VWRYGDLDFAAFDYCSLISTLQYLMYHVPVHTEEHALGVQPQECIVNELTGPIIGPEMLTRLWLGCSGDSCPPVLVGKSMRGTFQEHFSAFPTPRHSSAYRCTAVPLTTIISFFNIQSNFIFPPSTVLPIPTTNRR
jgi:hypothetical protein